MKHFNHRIVGPRTDLVKEDSFWNDCTVDLSFLSSDDQRSTLADNESLDTTKERELLVNPKVVTVLSEDDTEDIIWKGTLVNKNLGSGSKSMNSRRSVDDLSGFYKLNPLAPNFVPSSAKNEEGSSLSLKKSLSSDFPSSSGEFTVDGNTDAARKASVLVNNELGVTKKLDPLAPVFVPASATLTPLVNEKLGVFDARAHTDSKVVNTLVGRSVTIRYPDGVSKSKVGMNGFAKLGSSHGHRRLNPLAPKFSLADTKPKMVDSFGVEPNTTLSVNNSMDFQLPLPFHVVETASSNAGYGQGHSYAASSSSPKVDVKKLLTTIHGLSELLTFADGLDSTDAQELDLVNSTVQNLNSFVKNNIQEQAGTEAVRMILNNPYDLKLSLNKTKVSIRDFQLPMKEKYAMVSGGRVPDSRLFEYVETENNNFGQVVATNGYQQDHQGQEQVHPHALFYKSLWLKAEADRCLMVYETSLSNPTY